MRKIGILQIGLVVVLVLAAVVIVVNHNSHAAAEKLVWSDEFTGAAGAAPNPAKWNYAQGGDGWGNEELECYTDDRSNSALNGSGDLVITAQRAARHVCSDGKVQDYTSARLTTQGLETATYGRLEIRAQLPVGDGLWPAFWALGSNQPQVGWPASGEIDVAEVAGKDPSIVHGSLHGPQADGKPYDITATKNIGVSVNSGFHDYLATWTPKGISFSVDGSTYFTATKKQVEKSGTWVFGHPFYLLLDLAIGGNFGGPPTYATTWPRKMVVDYVRVYG